MYFAFIFQFIGVLNVNDSPEFRCEQVTVSVVNTAKKWTLSNIHNLQYSTKNG